MAETISLIAEIDFLPARYKEATDKRRMQAWRMLVGALFGGTLVAAGLFQHQLMVSAQNELDAVEPLRMQAMARTNELARLQAEVAELDLKAEQITFLRHPWPRTQILGAVLTPLPTEVTLTQLHLTREIIEKVAAPAAHPANSHTLSTSNPADAQKAPVDPARDLNRLRAETERVQAVVLLTGTTRDMDALHNYLAAVGRHSLFVKVELGAIHLASGAEEESAASFTARLLVRPGYGQPGGPELDPPAVPQSMAAHN